MSENLWDAFDPPNQYLHRFGTGSAPQEGSFALSYPQSHPRVDGRRKSGNTGER